MDRVRFFLDDKNQWRWHRVAGNGEIIAHGESHERLSNARRAARRANRDLPDEAFDPPTVA